MANAKLIQEKAAKVEAVQEKIKRAQSVILFDYRGLTVEEVDELRNQMRSAGIEYAVVKNGIVARAAKALNLDDSIYAMLKGPSAFAFGYDDAVAPAKILKDAIKKFKKCEIKGGIINGVVADADAVIVLADLPSRDQLLARMLGSMLSPISGLAVVLDQIAKKKEEGTPMAAAVDAPAPVVSEEAAVEPTVQESAE